MECQELRGGTFSLGAAARDLRRSYWRFTTLTVAIGSLVFVFGAGAIDHVSDWWSPARLVVLALFIALPLVALYARLRSLASYPEISVTLPDASVRIGHEQTLRLTCNQSDGKPPVECGLVLTCESFSAADSGIWVKEKTIHTQNLLVASNPELRFRRDIKFTVANGLPPSASDAKGKIEWRMTLSHRVAHGKMTLNCFALSVGSEPSSS